MLMDARLFDPLCNAKEQWSAPHSVDGMSGMRITHLFSDQAMTSCTLDMPIPQTRIQLSADDRQDGKSRATYREILVAELPIIIVLVHTLHRCLGSCFTRAISWRSGRQRWDDDVGGEERGLLGKLAGHILALEDLCINHCQLDVISGRKRWTGDEHPFNRLGWHQG